MLFVRAKKNRLLPLRVAPSSAAGQGFDAGQGGIVHGFRAQVGNPQKITVGVQHRQLCAASRFGQRFGLRVNTDTQSQLLLQGSDLCIAFEHLKAGINQTDAVKQSLQFGRLVHHMHGCRDFSAVMQQAGDLELIAVLLTHGEIR